MSVMAFYIYFGVAGLGVVGAMVLVGRYISGARSLSGEDQKKWLDRLPPFFTFLSDAWQRHVRPPSVRFWNAHIHSVFLGEGERWSRRFRIVALRIENVFRRMSDYFRGRRIAIQGNGNQSGEGAQGKNSQFWNEMQRLKSIIGEKTGEEKKP